MLKRMWEKGSPHSLLVGLQLVQPLCASWGNLKKLKINLPHDLAIPFFSIHPKDLTSYSRHLFSLAHYTQQVGNGNNLYVH